MTVYIKLIFCYLIIIRFCICLEYLIEGISLVMNKKKYTDIVMHSLFR